MPVSNSNSLQKLCMLEPCPLIDLLYWITLLLFGDKNHLPVLLNKEFRLHTSLGFGFGFGFSEVIRLNMDY